MIRHIVLFTWNDGTTEDDIAAVGDALATLPRLIPQIRRYEFGEDLGLAADPSFDFALVADFDDEDSWRAYLDHPEHVAVVTSAIRPVAARIDRIQYSV